MLCCVAKSSIASGKTIIELSDRRNVSFFSINIKKIKTQNLLHSTVPSKAGIDTRSSGPHFGWHLQF